MVVTMSSCSSKKQSPERGMKGLTNQCFEFLVPIIYLSDVIMDQGGKQISETLFGVYILVSKHVVRLHE